ncbi:MAG: hypothetical protein Q8P44_09530, partial [Dehalococcoidia bacterium]|nr:hypothetical protein [Dehalococcoidia bacterium]
MTKYNNIVILPPVVWSIEYYQSEAGKSPVEDFIDSLDTAAKASVVSHKWPYNLCHSGLDPESSLLLWIPAFAGMTP